MTHFSTRRSRTKMPKVAVISVVPKYGIQSGGSRSVRKRNKLAATFVGVTAPYAAAAHHTHTVIQRRLLDLLFTMETTFVNVIANIISHKRFTRWPQQYSRRNNPNCGINEIMQSISVG